MITRTQANRIASVGRGPAQAQAERFERVRDKTIPSLLAFIDSATPIAGATYRWLYAWTRAEIKTTASGTGYDFQSRPGEAFYTGNALNICEAANTASFVGPGIDPANIPAGFDVQPISGYVHLFPMRRITAGAAGGELVWCFYAPNAIDGTCGEAAFAPSGVTSVAAGYGVTGGPITTTGTLAISLTQQSAFLGTDVAMTSANTWYDGPTLSLAAGTWLVFASATVGRTATTAGNYDLRISTGSVHYASVQQYHASVANNWAALSCNGVAVLASTTTIKLQVAGTLTSDVLKAATPNNASGNNATGLIAVRVA
jgi:hypothetical protein